MSDEAKVIRLMKLDGEIIEIPVNDKIVLYKDETYAEERLPHFEMRRLDLYPCAIMKRRKRP